MKCFTKVLLGLSIISVVGITSAKAAIGYGHNTEVGVTGGRIKSQCYGSGTAYSGAMCTERNRAIQVRVIDKNGKSKSITSTGPDGVFRMTEGLTTAGNNYEHLHDYSTWILS